MISKRKIMVRFLDEVQARKPKIECRHINFCYDEFLKDPMGYIPTTKSSIPQERGITKVKKNNKKQNKKKEPYEDIEDEIEKDIEGDNHKDELDRFLLLIFQFVGWIVQQLVIDHGRLCLPPSSR